LVHCRDNEYAQKEYVEETIAARQRLTPFNILKDTFKNFQGYEAGHYKQNDNIIFWMFRNFYSENEQRLNKLENALSEFKKQWTSEEYAEFVTRLTSKERFKSYTALTEITTAFDIGEKLGYDNVKLYHVLPNKKKPDLFFKVSNNKEVFLELTALDLGYTEEKIKRILTDLEEYIVHKCGKKNFFISIHLDTSDLIHDKEGNIDEKISKIFLHTYVDKLNLCNLAGSNANIVFDDLPPDILNNVEYLSDLAGRTFLPSNVFDIISDSGVLGHWAKEIRMVDFYNSPFLAASLYESKDNACVEVQRREFDSNDPSLKGHELLRTSEAVRAAFLEHIKRALNEKVRHEQYEKGKPALIGIRAQNWRFNLEDYDAYVTLRDFVQGKLSLYPEISGVILYTDCLYYGRYIENKSANQEIRVTTIELEDARIIHKYINPLLTEDEQINFSALNEEQQESRVKQLIALQPEIILKQDKTALLRDLWVFLDRDKISTVLLALIDPVIKHYCNDPDPRIDENIQRSDLLSDEKSMWFDNHGIRCFAASCQLRFTRHSPTEQNVELCLKLSQDPNSIVREHVSSELSHLCRANHETSVKTAKKFIVDNRFVRWYLRGYLNYLLSVYPWEAYEICETIVQIYGKKELASKEEAELLKHVVKLVAFSSIILAREIFISLFEDLTIGSIYNNDVKRSIALALKEGRYLLDERFASKSIDIYTKLIENTPSIELHEYISFHLLYTLRKNEKIYYPTIKKFLDIIAEDKYPKGYSHTRFQILNYLLALWPEFPEEAAFYFIKIFEQNPFLSHDDHNTYKIIDFLKTSLIIESDRITNETKIKLIRILEKLVESNWPLADGLMREVGRNG
jgi:hypothetical protein